MPQTHYRTCNLCEAMCGIAIEYEGKQILSIKGDKNDEFSQGHICPKAVALQDIYHDPDRLKRPVRRTDDGWDEISWEEAFAEVVTKLREVQAAHGNDAVGIYLGNPNVHNYGSMLFGAPFIRALRTRNRFSATSADQLPHHFAGLQMFGHQLLLPIPDIDRTDFMLILGANPMASNGSIMTAAGVENRLKGIQQRGGRFVVVDPRRTETAVKADQHLFIRPGSDVLLLAALICTLFEEGLVDLGRLETITVGVEDLKMAVSPFTADRVAAPTGIDAETIRQLARDFAAAETAVCYGRMGASTQPFGGASQWLINAMNIITGNFDQPGGAMFTLPAVDVVGLTTMTGRIGAMGRWKSRVRNLPEFNGELPVAALAEEILTEGPGQIRAMVTMAGNPVLSTPNGRQVNKAFASLDYMVAIDIYINETTRHANIILPPATGLESDNYDVVFHLFAVRNSAKFSPALFPKEEGMLADWEILRELRLRLEATSDKQRPVSKFDLERRLPPEKIIDLGLRFGPYGSWGGKLQKDENGNGLSLRRLKANPHGVDLGALQPCLPWRLCTPDKRIQLAPEAMVADMARVEAEWLQDRNNGRSAQPLTLIGRRHLRSNNSWMHNSPRLVRGKNRCTVLMHPDDAQARNLLNKSDVEVRSRVGAVQLPLEISTDMMPGVVSIPHGWGHGRKGVRMKTAVAHPGVSINDLTDDQAIDTLTGNSAFSGVPVEITAVS
ncbi:MAG: molybdopterin oxidoreductase family protein [Chloroflexota bacterium]